MGAIFTALKEPQKILMKSLCCQRFDSYTNCSLSLWFVTFEVKTKGVLKDSEQTVGEGSAGPLSFSSGISGASLIELNFFIFE